MAKYLKKSDIFISGVKIDAASNSIKETLTCGLPVLYCTNGGGAHEVCNLAGEEYSDIKTMLDKMNKIKNIKLETLIVLIR